MGRARSTCPELSLRGRRSPLAPALHPQAAGRLAADGVPWLASLLPILTLTLCTLCLEERTEGGKALLKEGCRVGGGLSPAPATGPGGGAGWLCPCLCHSKEGRRRGWLCPRPPPLPNVGTERKKENSFSTLNNYKLNKFIS